MSNAFQPLFNPAAAPAEVAPPGAASAAASESTLLAYLQLASCRGAGPILVRRAIEQLGSAEAVVGASVETLGQVEGIGPRIAESVLASLDLAAARQELETARNDGIRILCFADDDYPSALKNIPDPPVVLYLRGQLLAADALAVGIVGARQCTLYGRHQADRFGSLLAAAHLTVISGGARGVDTAAHEGALRARGRTISVQGCGLHHCYPAENAPLYERLANGEGAVLAELPLNTPPAPKNFLPRNRIIAGMSLGVLVVEANLRSGSLTTARLAGEDYGREVFALPGRIDSPASQGANNFIKRGAAALVERIDDILGALSGPIAAVAARLSAAGPAASNAATSAMAPSPPSAPAHRPAAPPPAAPATRFTPAQQKILEALHGRETSVDDLCETTGLSPSVLLTELTFLQLGGAVVRGNGQTFARAR